MDSTGPAAVYQTLLEINNALISNLTREGLFHAIATAIGRVIPFERIAVFLHDPVRDVLTKINPPNSAALNWPKLGTLARASAG